VGHPATPLPAGPPVARNYSFRQSGAFTVGKTEGAFPAALTHSIKQVQSVTGGWSFVDADSSGMTVTYDVYPQQRVASGEPVTTENHTRAEGLATGTSFDLPQLILRERLDDFVLVSDEEIEAAVRLLIENTRTLVEMAGAAPLAGALRLRERLAGKRVCLITSGANITPEQLRGVLSAS